MLLIPAFALLLAAGTTVLIRKRPSRIQWVVHVVSGLIIWFLSLVMLLAIPNEVSFALWRPAELFRPPVELLLDRTSWSLVYSAATVLLSVILTSAARPNFASARQRAFWFVYTSLAMLAFFSNNLLTAVLILAAIDLFSFIFLIIYTERVEDVHRAIVRIGIDLTGTLLLISAVWVNEINGSGEVFGSAASTSLAALLFLLGILLRLGLIPTFPSLHPLPRGAGTLLRLVPSAIALSLLAKFLASGAHPAIRTWLFLAGLIGLIVGGVRWLLEEDRVFARHYLVIGLAGIGILVSSIPSVEGDVLFVTSALLLLVGALLSLIEIYTPSHRMWSIFAVALLAGIPWSPGGLTTSVLGQAAIVEGMWIQALLGIIGMSILALGAFHTFFEEEKSWNSSESLIRVMYSMGLALPVLVSFGLGFWIRNTFSIYGLLVTTAVILVGVGEFFVFRKLSGTESFERLKSIFLRLNLEWVYASVWNIIRRSLSIARSIGELFEGEAAMLWMFAFIALLFLALR